MHCATAAWSTWDEAGHAPAAAITGPFPAVSGDLVGTHTLAVTNWGTRAHRDMPELLADYEPSVGALVIALHPLWGKENSDPVRVAQVVVRLAASDHLPAHLLLGSDAIRYAGEAEAKRAAEGEHWREISSSTDFNAAAALPDLQF